MTIKNLRLWLGALLLGALIAGCGGSSSGTMSQIRLLNASPDLTSASLYTDDDERASGIAPETISGYSEVDKGSYTVKLTDSIGASLATVDQDLDRDTRYTAVAWGRSGATKLTLLTEADDDGDDLDSGWGRLRVFNAAGNEAGGLDIYLLPSTTTGTVDLNSSTPVIGSASTTPTSYSELRAGSYRLLVTAAGDPDDLRLDLPLFELHDQQLLTLVLEPSSGGSRVHALVVAHQGSMVATKNPSARLRVIASLASAGSLQASRSGSTFGAAMTSPQIGGYALTLANSEQVRIQIKNGQDLSVDAPLASGGDYTVLVTGTSTTDQAATLITDDNRLPTNSARAKVRLVNGYGSGGGAATLAINSVAVGSASPGVGAATSYTQITPTNAAIASVSVGGTTLWSTTSTDATVISAGGVYTVFLLDGATTTANNATTATATGRLLSERTAVSTSSSSSSSTSTSATGG